MAEQPKGRTSLARETSTLVVGQPAPDFDLAAHDGERVRLSDLRGRRVVLAFLVAAFTGGWSQQAPSLSAYKERFAAAGAQVLGMTCDPTPSLAAWAKQLGKLDFPLLSDFWPHGEVSRAYGVLNEERGTSRRSVFIVDEQGVVRYIDVHQRGELPDEEQILEALAAL